VETLQGLIYLALGAACAITALAGFRRFPVRQRAELRRLRDAHTHARALFAAVFEAPGRAVTLETPDGELLEANRVMVDLLGYSAAELRRMHYSQYTVDAGELAEDNRLLAEVLEGKRDHYTLEKRFRRKDGEIFWGSLHVSKIHGDDGETILVATISDVDERKQLEEQLRQAQKMEAVGGLAGGVAHDFNNLLTVIVGYSDVAKTARDETELAESIDAIRLAADRASSLTRQLLAFSRKQVVQLRRLDLNASLANVVSLLERVLRADIDLDVTSAQEPLVVDADPAQIEQVLLNLVLNSQDAISGRGTISVTTRRVTFSADAAARAGIPEGDYAQLEVADTGCGMDDATADRAFEPFFTTKGPGAGTGLGLATVYGIVQAAGGVTTIASTPGLGTVVTVTLPAMEVELPATAAAPDIAVDEPPLAATVLLVEDEDVVRDLTAAALSRSGYTVLEAASGEDALALVDGHVTQLDVLLTDVVMPGMRGPALAERLRDAHPELGVVFMSGYSDVEVDLAATGAQWLQKPFRTTELCEAVAQAAQARTAVAS
jgi:PAS domain S-box-containing protein